MAPPVGIPMALGIASAGASLASGYIQGKDAEAESQAAAQAAMQNAQKAEQNAQLTRQQAAENMRQSRLDSLQTLGSARAAYGASGVDLSVGSPLDVLASDAATAERDALKIQRQGEITASQYDQQAQMDRQQAGNLLEAGRRRSRSSTILGGLNAIQNLVKTPKLFD